MGHVTRVLLLVMEMLVTRMMTPPQIEKDFFVNSRMDIPRRGCDPGHHII
jgi:hypothetical protein